MGYIKPETLRSISIIEKSPARQNPTIKIIVYTSKKLDGYFLKRNQSIYCMKENSLEFQYS